MLIIKYIRFALNQYWFKMEFKVKLKIVVITILFYIKELRYRHNASIETPKLLNKIQKHKIHHLRTIHRPCTTTPIKINIQFEDTKNATHYQCHKELVNVSYKTVVSALN